MANHTNKKTIVARINAAAKNFLHLCGVDTTIQGALDEILDDF